MAVWLDAGRNSKASRRPRPWSTLRALVASDRER